MEPDEIQNQQENQNQNPPPGIQQSDEVVPQWMVLLNEERAARLKAEQEAATLRNQPPAPTQQTPTLQEGELYTNPDKLISILEQRMQNQVAPLNEFVAAQRRATEYAGLKQRVLGMNPAFAQQFRMIEPLVDSMMVNVEVNEANFQSAIQRAVGQIVLQNPGVLTGQQHQQQNNNQQYPQNTQQQNAGVMPPHLRPSVGAPSSNSAPTPVKIELTENERRVARENGMTPEEYVAMRDATPYEMEQVWKDILKKRKGGK